jgi:tagaturonate reductase
LNENFLLPNEAAERLYNEYVKDMSIFDGKSEKCEGEIMKPVKILQFGGGNFLRCFFDWMLQRVSDTTGIEYEVTLAQLTPGEPVFDIAAAKEYHVLLRGYEGTQYVETLDAVRVIKNAVSPLEKPAEYIEAGCEDISLILSNSTEAGIFFDPAATHNYSSATHNYPSRLAMLLEYRARKHLPPVMIMAMELNDRSGDLLKKTLLQYGQSFAYGMEFFNYIESCSFYNTLVDRIVPGYPADAADRVFEKIGHQDQWLTSGELFHLFVIEGDRKILDVIPFDQAGLNVIVTDDKLDFYHGRKVRILNGAHTASVPVALLNGIENVDVFASHPEYSAWLSEMTHKEICRAMDDSTETHAYADDVLARFKNPALGHSFRSIALNSVAKVNARMRPTLVDYFSKEGCLPPLMTEAIGKMCELYGGSGVVELPGGALELKDFSQIHGLSLSERLESFFPGLSAEIQRALLHELS